MHENNIEFTDFASGTQTVKQIVDAFHASLDSDADLIWIIRRGNTCIQTLFNCSRIKRCNMPLWTRTYKHYIIFSTPKDKQFIINFLKKGFPVSENPNMISSEGASLNLNEEKIIGGHLVVFTIMQGQLQIDLKDRYVFIVLPQQLQKYCNF